MTKTLLQINSFANTGSTGKIAEQIGKTVLEEGWGSYLAYGRRATNSSSILIKVGTKYDVFNHVVCARLFDTQGLSSVRVTRHFIKYLDTIDFDIVHLHNIHGYYINYKILFSYLKKRNVPIVWTMHDCWPFTGHCVHFAYNGCNKWKTHCDNCPDYSSYPKSLFIDRSYKNYDEKKEAFCSVLDKLTIVPVSHWLEVFIKESFLKDANRIETIHNGIDLDMFRPLEGYSVKEKYSIPKDNKLILGVASPWSKKKGLEDFFKLRTILEDDYTIVLVGLSNKQIQLLPKGIVGITRTDNQKELARLYSSALAFVNPTYEDNYPTTNLEALACGTPVIAYNTGGTAEALTDLTGYLINQGDVNHIALNIHNLSSDHQREVIKTKCREWALQNCDSTKVFKRYYDLYSSLLR